MSNPYSNGISFERLMLLVAAIAQNPGIAPHKGRNAGVDPMETLLEAMREIAQQRHVEWQSWSVNTIRADLKTLRKYGILPDKTMLRAGYYLGKKQEEFKLPPKQTSSRKSRLTAEEMAKLRASGQSLAQIAKQAGVSRERVRQLLSSGVSG